MMGFLKKFLIIVLAFLLPIKGLLILTGVAIFVDTLSGLYKAFKTKDKITSRKLSNIISKFFLYEFAILFAFVLDKYLLGELVLLLVSVPFLITKIVTVTLIFIEVYSINENVRIITGVSFFQKLKEMVTRAKSIKDDINEFK